MFLQGLCDGLQVGLKCFIIVLHIFCALECVQWTYSDVVLYKQYWQDKLYVVYYTNVKASTNIFVLVGERIWQDMQELWNVVLYTVDGWNRCKDEQVDCEINFIQK